MATRSRVDAVVAVVVSERIIQGVGMLRGGKSGGGIIDSGACVCVCVVRGLHTPSAGRP